MPQWFISFPEFAEFSESSAPFRKNLNQSNLSLYLVLFINISVAQELFYVLILAVCIILADQCLMVHIILALVWLTTVIVVTPEEAPSPVRQMDSGVKDQLATVVWTLTSKVNIT